MRLSSAQVIGKPLPAPLPTRQVEWNGQKSRLPMPSPYLIEGSPQRASSGGRLPFGRRHWHQESNKNGGKDRMPTRGPASLGHSYLAVRRRCRAACRSLCLPACAHAVAPLEYWFNAASGPATAFVSTSRSRHRSLSWPLLVFVSYLCLVLGLLSWPPRPCGGCNTFPCKRLACFAAFFFSLGAMGLPKFLPTSVLQIALLHPRGILFCRAPPGFHLARHQIRPSRRGLGDRRRSDG
ncbi:hypothetical protein GQ53DRAFT_206693 [Thozetella sp. PMI_491]|nr:hypothetical protein GQ53DRAFT_206693 [Thozetella sp. PMI_491]